MTREEAIEYLSPIAVSAVLPRYKEALGMAIAALKVVEIDQVKNEPLTLDELRQMDGEAVYLPTAECWVLVSTTNFFPEFIWKSREHCSAADWYNLGGPAYRHKPEEVEA